MKKTLIFILAISMIALIIAPLATAQETISYRNQNSVVIAADSAATNTITKYSKIFTIFQKTGKPSTSVNYLKGLKVFITGSQLNDSLNLQISLQVGQISGGTLKKHFVNIVLDTLTASKQYLIVDLATYNLLPECRLKAVGLATGNGISAVWNAKISGIGYVYPTNDAY
jgi:hypothetical protein